MNNIRKEKYKTILLTVLFVLSVALTQQLWFTLPVIQNSFATKPIEMEETNDNESVKRIVDILGPQSLTVNFGGGLHTALYDDSYGIWQQSLELMDHYYFEGETKIEEISRDQWVEISNTRSIGMNFATALPITLLTERINKEQIEIVQKIPTLDGMLVSLVDDFSIYIANRIEGKYYRVKGKGMDDTLLQTMETIEKSGYDVYYALKDIYGIENNKLMPVALNESFPVIDVAQEIEPSNNLKMESFAGTFFGENFDFVRKIIETSGSVIYMYGYGQKALKIDATGVLEYVEELDSQKSGNAGEFAESIKMAVQFVSDHGGWPNKRAYLRRVNYIEKDKKKGYQFLFGYRLNGLPIYYDEKRMGNPIEIQVIGNQVTYYRRLIKKEEIAVSFLQNMENDVLLSPSQVLDKNFDLIMTNYLKDRRISQEQLDKNEVLNEVLTSIQGVSIGYYNQGDGVEDQLIPVWVVNFDGKIYYFDAYTGEMINGFEL